MHAHKHTLTKLSHAMYTLTAKVAEAAVRSLLAEHAGADDVSVDTNGDGRVCAREMEE